MGVTIALIIFLCSYFFIVSKNLIELSLLALVERSCLLFGVYELNAAFLHHIDWHTITLLLAMMILVSITSQSGFFEYVAVTLAKGVNGRPLPLLIAITSLNCFWFCLFQQCDNRPFNCANCVYTDQFIEASGCSFSYIDCHGS